MKRPNIGTPTKNLEDAITAEAHDWAEFFEANTPEQIEARKMVMRANASVGYFKPLEGYYNGPDTPVVVLADDFDLSLTLQPDGYFCAIDRNNYDVDCDHTGFFTRSPQGHGRTPLDAIVDLIDNTAES